MSDIENYYQEKDEKEKEAKVTMLFNQIDKYIEVITQAKSYVLNSYKQNPPEKHIWLIFDEKRYLAWEIGDAEHRYGDFIHYYLFADGFVMSSRYDDYDDETYYYQLDIRNDDYSNIKKHEQDYLYFVKCIIQYARKAGAPDDIFSAWCQKLGLVEQNRKCYIATAVYGSCDAPEVLTLRRFRDEVLQPRYLGRLFINIYYKTSPPIANRIESAQRVNNFVRFLLNIIVGKIRKNRYK